VAVVEFQGQRLDADKLAPAHVDEPEKAEIVPQTRIDSVVVDEAAQIEEHTAGDTVKGMRRMPGDRRGARPG
jgi:hypothetical protein